MKGIGDFVAAAEILLKRGPDPPFVVLGDDLKNGGATRRAMEARVAAAGMSGRFRFLGFRKDAPRPVQAFDVIAVPSHVEPLGNATLEAMAAGRPVVGTHVGGIPEMVVDGVTGCSYRRTIRRHSPSPSRASSTSPPRAFACRLPPDSGHRRRSASKRTASGCNISTTARVALCSPERGEAA